MLTVTPNDKEWGCFIKVARSVVEQGLKEFCKIDCNDLQNAFLQNIADIASEKTQ